MMIAALMLMSVGAFAQEAGRMAAGADADIIFRDGENRIAIGAKFQYCITENFRAEANLKFYPKKWETTVFNPNVNIQYVIPVIDKLNIYPLVGCGLAISKYDGHDGSESTTAFVFQGGAGAEYFFTDSFKGFFEAWYQYGKKDGYAVMDNPLLSAGVAFCF